ncbi:uncharacterized protein EAE98_002569 [Botrytis deweyae]|uniref:Uncharacterized protein n=1 Tax=Botrytis deweyae TaxID=2478750 RepID=A0ABQ7IXI2_9HELO|nr:uncharacterized protein EAE98_002569 [Botrytis deweyae]KAF7936350.1 hypothetical protein EAE98_002569 [Botrytis deweyae]
MPPKRNASEMMGSSGKAKDSPLKRMKEMLKDNADKVTFSNDETSQFAYLIINNTTDIISHKQDIKKWKQCIKDAQKAVGELEKTNKEYEEDIEKNRQEIEELKREEEMILAIQKQGEAREEKLQGIIQKDLKKFLEGELEKAGLSLEKESEGDQTEKIEGDEGKKMVKDEI